MRSTRVILSGVLFIALAGWIAADSDDDKGGHDDHGHTHDGGGVGGGITIDVDGMTRDKKEPDPFGGPAKPASKPHDETNVDVPPHAPPSGPPPPIYVDDEIKEPCHCEAARMIVIAGVFDPKNPEGPKTDRTMLATLKWVRTLHLHKLRIVTYYSGQSGNNLQLEHPMELIDTKPKAPPAADGTKTDDKRWVWQTVDPKTLTDSWTDCCYYEEVLVFMHGSQNAFPDLIKIMPTLLGGRPVKKLIVWSCKSTKKFAPGHGADFDIYSQFCAIVAPKDCPCGCDPTKCTTVDPDHCPTAPKPFCPSKTTPVKILAAWYYLYKPSGMALAVPLGLDPTDEGSPFTSPDGNVREIHMDPDPAKPGAFILNVLPNPPGAGTEIFACKKVKPDAKLLNAYIVPDKASDEEKEAAKDARSNNEFRPEVILKATKIDEKLVKKSTVPFQGKNVCPKGDGCQQNPKTG